VLEAIGDSINKAWVLGDGRFKQQIEKNRKTGIGLMLEGVIGSQSDIEQEKEIIDSDLTDWHMLFILQMP